MFQATIHHHSISRARSITAKTLAAAKRKAAREFRDEFTFYNIVIVDDYGFPVASKRCGARHWRDLRFGS